MARYGDPKSIYGQVFYDSEDPPPEPTKPMNLDLIKLTITRVPKDEE